MMGLKYERWPFLNASMRTPEQNTAWWETCFVPTSIIDAFIHSPGSAVITGMPGAGKTTALAALTRTLKEHAFLVPYPPQHWPNGPRPWLPERGHVGQIMAAAATEFVRFFQDRPQQFAGLGPLQEEFLYWLVEKHLGRRVLARLLYQVERETELDADLPDHVKDLYPDDTQETAVWNQIGELVELAQALSYERVIIAIDVDHREGTRYLDDMVTLFGWLDLMEHRSCAIRAVLPQHSVNQAQIGAHARGRLNLMRLAYGNQVRQEIVNRHLQVATDGACTQVEVLAETAVLQRARKEIEILYGANTVAGWLDWVQTLLAMKPEGKQVVDGETAVAAFYQHRVPLQLDTERRGVWRGPQFLPLDNQPYEIMAKLFELRGQPAPDALVQLAGSGPNLNTLVSRLRKAVEPVKGENVYLHNRRDQGYWLENFII